MKLDPASWHLGSSPLRDALFFVAGTIALSWLFWLPAAVLQVNGSVSVAGVLLLIGSFVPLAVALYLNLWVRTGTFEFRRWFGSLKLKTIFLALVLPVLFLIPVILWRLWDGTFDLVLFLQDLRGLPVMLPGFFVLAFCEEVGWRGLLLRHLASYRPFLVNVGIALAWFVWQIPVIAAQPHDAFPGGGLQHLAAFLFYSILITPFLNRLALRSDMNVFLPALFRASLNVVSFVYGLQSAADELTHPMGFGVLAWLVALNVILFGQLWLGRPAEVESELGRVMPLEPVIR